MLCLHREGLLIQCQFEDGLKWLHASCMGKHSNLVYNGGCKVTIINKDIDLLSLKHRNAHEMYSYSKDVAKECGFCELKGFLITCVVPRCNSLFHPSCAVKDN